MTDWISMAEAERQFGYAPRGLQSVVRRGRIKSKRIGSTHLVSRASVAAWVASNPQPGRKPKEQK